MKISWGYLWKFSQEGNLKSDRLEHSISVYLLDKSIFILSRAWSIFVVFFLFCEKTMPILIKTPKFAFFCLGLPCEHMSQERDALLTWVITRKNRL